MREEAWAGAAPYRVFEAICSCVRAAPRFSTADGLVVDVAHRPCAGAEPSRGQGREETRFPPTPAPAAYVHMRRSCAWRTTPRCTWPRSAGGTPAPRRRGHGAGPLPDPPPPGAGTRLLPPAGGGWEGGSTLRTMVTSAVHAARAAHRRDENRLFLGGLRPPKPSRGWGNGWRCGSASPPSTQTLPRVGEWGNPVSPSPCGAGAWGNPVSPHPSPRAYVHVSHPCGSRRTPTG